MGNRGTHPQAAGCHDTLQSRASILHDICQASITRDMACRGEGRETIRLERILFKKFPLFWRRGKNRGFRELLVHGRNTGTSPGVESFTRSKPFYHFMARGTDMENYGKHG